jgi:hypothetical protein
MKAMTHSTEVHPREEFLCGLTDAALAYKPKRSEVIEGAVSCVWNGQGCVLKTVVHVLNYISHKYSNKLI